MKKDLWETVKKALKIAIKIFECQKNVPSTLHQNKTFIHKVNEIFNWYKCAFLQGQL